MGTIVGAFTTSHVLFSPEGVEDQAERVFQGMREIGNRIRKLGPDLVVVVSSDHLINLGLALQPPFVVGVADEYVPHGDMGVPKERIEGHRDFAEQFIRQAGLQHFDLAKAEEWHPDHGVAIPNLFFNRDARFALVPLIVNVTMEPAPAPGRCWELGGLLGRFIREHRPQDETVVVLGTGGLSHWIGLAEQGRINVDFDRYVIDRLISGDVHELTDMGPEELSCRAGNGGLEIVNWLLVAASVEGCDGELIYYEPIEKWLTGMGGMAMNVSDRSG